MQTYCDASPTVENLKATDILDIAAEECRNLTQKLQGSNPNSDLAFLKSSHHHLIQTLQPVYSLDELQPASITLKKGRGSCSQRLACLEALARAAGVPTRVRALSIKGSFWAPRFRLTRFFIPSKILLLWPQFFVEQRWLDFDELHASLDQLAMGASDGFKNDSESLFEAVVDTPVDFLGKTCGRECFRPEYDLSNFVVADHGLFNTRDEVFARSGSLQHSIRGRLFELIFGDKTSK